MLDFDFNASWHLALKNLNFYDVLWSHFEMCNDKKYSRDKTDSISF